MNNLLNILFIAAVVVRAGVVDVQFSSGGMASSSQLTLNPMDSVVFHNAAMANMTVVQVSSLTDCTPLAGGLVLATAPTNGSATNTFTQAGVSYLSTREACGAPGTIVKHIVNAFPVNQYTAKASALIAAIKLQALQQSNVASTAAASPSSNSATTSTTSSSMLSSILFASLLATLAL